MALSDADLLRTEAAHSLKLQREARDDFTSIEDFLQEIDITLEVHPLSEPNLARVVQMFQKSNQFNLTTRRHGETELKQLQSQSGRIGVFSYTDKFGTQGIISVITLVESDEVVEIESWLMSCRVLNRTVEEAVFCWATQIADHRPLVGEYIPTEKNKLVKDLYPRLGFEHLDTVESTGTERWRYNPSQGRQLPKHFVSLRAA